MVTPRELSTLYQRAHDYMRNIDGLQPNEAFDELLKYLFFKQCSEQSQQRVASPLLPDSNGSFLGVDGNAISKVRSLFRDYLSKADSWGVELWQERAFRLSDAALVALHRLLEWITFSEIRFDIRSTALKTFLTPQLRRGLGIFLTPDDVAKMMVQVVAPTPNARVYDPACGSGTFLIEVLKNWESTDSQKTRFEIWGSDVNPRMLALAQLNLGYYQNVVFHSKKFDMLGKLTSDTWPSPNTFDVIFTNPPFGVVADKDHYPLEDFETCFTRERLVRDRQQSEVMFVERCLRLLKPGGILAIVLPKSVISNGSLADARQAIEKLGYIYAVVSLPPETFAVAGTQTTTSVLFFKKFTTIEKPQKKIRIIFGDVKNVGYDSTGRQRVGNELSLIAASLHNGQTDTKLSRHLDPVEQNDSLSRLSGLISKPRSHTGSIRLANVLEFACTGKTPARSDYTDSGMFIVKVGNLTGRGINWKPRDRNFISNGEGLKRSRSDGMMIKPDDILLTSSAHSPNYIAKKIDIVAQIPDYIGGQATVVGEVMLLRPKQNIIDPYALLAFLRSPETVERIQTLIRGQTAHLMPIDVENLEIPRSVCEPNAIFTKLGSLLRKETELAVELNYVSHQIEKLNGSQLAGDSEETIS